MKCGNCGASEHLHVHHIVPVGLGGSERASNKVTLCVDCHAKVHGWDAGYAEAWKRGMEQPGTRKRRKKTPEKQRRYRERRAAREGRILRSFRGHPYSKRTPEILEQIKSLFLGGSYNMEISKKLGMSTKTVRAALRQLGLWTPTRRGIKTTELFGPERPSSPAPPRPKLSSDERRARYNACRRKWRRNNREKWLASRARWRARKRSATQPQLFDITGQLSGTGRNSI